MSIAPRDTPVDLTGQVALVTGGGRGLGRAFALALATAGARVTVTARTAAQVAETVQLVERARGCALAIPGDVSVPDAVAHVVTATEQQLGPVDLLVNNAGWYVPGSLGRPPERLSRASLIASRRVVFTRSPAFWGISDGGHDPADLAFFGQIAVEPVATGARFIDKDQRFAFWIAFSG